MLPGEEVGLVRAQQPENPPQLHRDATTRQQKPCVQDGVVSRRGEPGGVGEEILDQNRAPIRARELRQVVRHFPAQAYQPDRPQGSLRTAAVTTLLTEEIRKTALQLTVSAVF